MTQRHAVHMRDLARSTTAGDEHGGASVLGLVVIGLLVGLVCAVAPIGGVLAAHQRLQGAADAAALAAADIASGRVAGGVPCEAAAALAASAGARLDDCALAGQVAHVSLSTELLGFALHAEARAGPPPVTFVSASGLPRGAPDGISLRLCGEPRRADQRTMAST